MQKLYLGILFIFVFATNANASLNCAPLEPKGGSDTSSEVQGKINGKVDGLFAKLAGADIGGDVVYKEIKRETLKEYPEASDLYLKERMIYLQCESLKNSNLDDQQKSSNLTNFSILILGLQTDDDVKKN